MKRLIQFIFISFLLTLSTPAFSGIDTSKYDSEVSNYILEIYQRFHGREVSQSEFEKYYMMVVRNPSVSEMANMTMAIHRSAKAMGNGIPHEVFVVSLQRLVLGQNPRTLSYGNELVQELVLQLDSDQISQSDLLNKTLKQEMAIERMGELLTGQIQTERFAYMKVTQN